MKRWGLHGVFFFHLYKEHSIKFFFIWTEGVEQVFFAPPPLLYKVSSWLLAHSSLLFTAFLLPLIVNSVCTPCLLTGWWKFPHDAPGNEHYR